MNTAKYRHLSKPETELLIRLLSEDFSGRDILQAQVENSLVRTIDKNNSLEFRLVSTLTRADTLARIPVEGQFPDIDGVMIYVLLHVINGVINELEIFKADSSPVIEMPDANNLELFHPYSD